MKLAGILLGTVALIALTNAKEQKKPNIVFIFTDDQDYRLDSLNYMPNVQKYLVNEGTMYKNHYATIAICCPSRVGLLRGQYAHNTNITDVSPPYGGYNRFNTLKLGDDYLPLWLQKSGYNTNYIGKLMNQYSVNNYNDPTPKGFDYQEQLVDPYTYVYNTAVFSVNGEAPVYYKDAYQTDIVHAKTRAALKRVQAQDDPFFLWVAPMAPHGQFEIGNDGSMKTSSPVPAARHAHLFKDVQIPRTPHFNPETQVKTASYWKELEKLNATLVEEFDETYRNRLRALQSVDEMVGTIFEELEKSGELDNTFVIYSADNGYHLGQHRALPGKCTNMEEDINVPFIVRGPGVEKGKTSELVSAHHDLAPTFVALAGGDQYIPSWVDGGVIPLTKALKNHRKHISKESFAVEFWSEYQMAENYDNMQVKGPNTYKTLRVISEDYNYMYTVWCTGEHEFYDLKKDPYEMNNLYDQANIQLVNRLDALLIVLKSCRAETCRDPWKVLHPTNKSVKTLQDALDEKYNAHYTQFKTVQYEECIGYYDAANELPQIGQHFTANTTKRHNDVANQYVLKSLRKRSNEEGKFILPKEYHDLFKLVPESTKSVGHAVPDEDFESHALPIDDKLIQNPVNWAEYNFYGFGN
ncbi:alkaline-phosphatase-like protein [Mucor mucedo]|uniref:alkaline-phosphatase-like protein n=1 Tax=Mucor mucedo TaxID=29922 RepID=UPI00221F40CA|nr:alkaline-phosphatase-like protein [Mucor mucedo]KAI7896354.1 alkaline-phosphatase-like protein [Mucor mucedo]